VRLLALAALLLVAGRAQASEIFAALSTHATDTPFSDCCEERGRGSDIHAGWRSGELVDLKIASLRAQVRASINTAGGVSYLAGGAALRFNLVGLYVQPALGLAVHTGPDGDAQPPDDGRRYLGSRLLLAPELVVGLRVLPGLAIEAAWTHVSHAQLGGRQNPGMDQFGIGVAVQY